MVTIRVSTVVVAPPEVVWADLRVIDRHVEWMHDAEEIYFTSSARQGVGTAFDCITKVGPIRMTDRLVVTEWTHARTMGICHRGLVTGEGRFNLEALPGTSGAVQTELTWTETLRFGWRLGGSFGAALARPVLRLIWQRNLRNFAKRF